MRADRVHLVERAGQLQYEKNGVVVPMTESMLLSLSPPTGAGAPLFACSKTAATTHQASQTHFKTAQTSYWFALGSLLVGVVASPAMPIAAAVSIYFSVQSRTEQDAGVAHGIDAMNMHNDDSACTTPNTSSLMPASPEPAPAPVAAEASALPGERAP